MTISNTQPQNTTILVKQIAAEKNTQKGHNLNKRLPTVGKPGATQKTTEKTVQRSLFKRRLVGILGARTVIALSDAALANILCLETLYHGTGPMGYIGISLNGADPNYGGDSTGSSAGLGRAEYVERSQNYFHVFKDSELFYATPIQKYIAIPLQAKAHAVLSGMATFNYQNAEGLSQKARIVAGVTSGILTPNLKFRFTPEEVFYHPSRFQNDPDYATAAYRTPYKILADRIGTRGTLTYGIDSTTLDRMNENEPKILAGLFMLAIAALIGRFAYKYATERPIVTLPERVSSDISWVNKKIAAVVAISLKYLILIAAAEATKDILTPRPPKAEILSTAPRAGQLLALTAIASQISKIKPIKSSLQLLNKGGDFFISATFITASYIAQMLFFLSWITLSNC